MIFDCTAGMLLVIFVKRVKNCENDLEKHTRILLSFLSFIAIDNSIESNDIDNSDENHGVLFCLLTIKKQCAVHLSIFFFFFSCHILYN